MNAITHVKMLKGSKAMIRRAAALRQISPEQLGWDRDSHNDAARQFLGHAVVGEKLATITSEASEFGGEWSAVNVYEVINDRGHVTLVASAEVRSE